MSRSVRPVALVVVLTVMWVALWGEVTPANVLGGVAAALVALALFRSSGAGAHAPVAFRPLAVISLVAWFLVQLVKSNVIIATLVVRRHVGDRTLVVYRAHTANPTVVTLLANAITLTPGTLSVDVAGDPDDGWPVLTLHALQAHRAPEATVAGVRAMEWRLLRAFGSPAEAAAADPRRES